jgi:hypothetical protein
VVTLAGGNGWGSVFTKKSSRKESKTSLKNPDDWDYCVDNIY